MLAIFPGLRPEALLCCAITRYADSMTFPHFEKGLREVLGLDPGKPEGGAFPPTSNALSPYSRLVMAHSA